MLICDGKREKNGIFKKVDSNFNQSHQKLNPHFYSLHQFLLAKLVSSVITCGSTRLYLTELV